MESTPNKLVEGYLAYGLTISPPMQKFVINPDNLLRSFEFIHKDLKKFCKHYLMYPEFDESGRLHYHGIVQPYDRVKFDRWGGVMRKHGFIKYEVRSRTQPLNIPRWLEYCSKGVAHTNSVIGIQAGLPITPEHFKLRSSLERRGNKLVLEEVIERVWESDDLDDATAADSLY